MRILSEKAVVSGFWRTPIGAQDTIVPHPAMREALS